MGEMARAAQLEGLTRDSDDDRKYCVKNAPHRVFAQRKHELRHESRSAVTGRGVGRGTND